MRRVMGLGILMVAFAVTLAACSGSGGPPPAATSTGGENPWQKTAVWVLEQGQVKAQPFENGQTVGVGSVVVEVFIAPYPPLREGSIDLYVTDKATSAPVEGGDLQMIFDMYMPHGVIQAEALPTGGGHYLVPYKLVMPGEFKVDLTITQSRDVAALAFIFRVD